MLNNDCLAVHIIRRARKFNKDTPLLAKELNYVFYHQDLHNLDKLIWAHLATRSADDPMLVCTIELRGIARLFETNTMEVFKALLRLKQLGFLALGLDVHLTKFAIIQFWMGKEETGEIPLGILEEVTSIHCGLLLPNSGLIQLMPSQVTPLKKPIIEPEKIIKKKKKFLLRRYINWIRMAPAMVYGWKY